MEELTEPLLALHGSGDRVTPPSGTEELYRRAHSIDKTLKIYPGLYHDLIHEPEKEHGRHRQLAGGAQPSGRGAALSARSGPTRR
jgi:alpha-beta hydrolase superfamily lysophospholipase